MIDYRRFKDIIADSNIRSIDILNGKCIQTGESCDLESIIASICRELNVEFKSNQMFMCVSDSDTRYVIFRDRLFVRKSRCVTNEDRLVQNTKTKVRS